MDGGIVFVEEGIVGIVVVIDGGTVIVDGTTVDDGIRGALLTELGERY